MNGGTEDATNQKTADILIKFLNTFPVEERKTVTNSLIKLREKLSDVISNTNPIAPFLAQIKQLRLSFLRTPLFLRTNLKSILIDGLEASIDGPNASLSIFTICLCLIEFNVLRNSDRSDLEGDSILATITQLNSRVIPHLTKRVLDQRTNLPSLLSWSLCMLIFTFQACLEWLTIQNYSFTPGHEIGVTKQVLEHPSIPLFMRIALTTQLKRRSYFTPNYPHSLLDMMFANATTNNTNHLNASKAAVKYDSSKCPLELDEPPVRPIKLANHKIPELNQKEELNSLPVSFQESLKSGSSEEVCSNLKLLHRLAVEVTDIFKSPLLDNLILALQSTPFILLRLKHQFSNTTKSDKNNMAQLKIYEEIYCLLLKLWFYSAEQRVLLKHWSQSYEWLVAFTYPSYDMMSLNGFVEIVLWTARLLTAYQSCFRSSILASPHWYLQMITDVVVELINRSEKSHAQGVLDDELEEALTTCIIAISRPFSALHADESSIRQELSRVIKTPLESILARIATCRSASDMTATTTTSSSSGNSSKNSRTNENIPSRPAISPRIRELLLNHLLFPMLRIIDPWALGQARLGMRPAAAKALLKQILTTTADNVETSWDDVRVPSNLELPKANPAVGGLHVAEKLSLKRRHR